jgi:hypothetical protein
MQKTDNQLELNSVTFWTPNLLKNLSNPCHFSSPGGFKAACMNLQKKLDSVGNEENGYLVPDHNKEMTKVTKEPSHAYKKISKRKTQKKSQRNSWRKN